MHYIKNRTIAYNIMYSKAMKNLSDRNIYLDIIVEIMKLKSETVEDYMNVLHNIHDNVTVQFLNELASDIGIIMENVQVKSGKLSVPVKNLMEAQTWLQNKAREKVFNFEINYHLSESPSREYEKKLIALGGVLNDIQASPHKMDSTLRKNRKKIPKENKIRAELQKEIGSKCPFCSNEDVGHFEIHHINNNPGENDIANLILVCPTCHSKITKGDITPEKVKEVKSDPPKPQSKIEFVSATIDSDNCSWYAKDDLIFYDQESEKSSFPVIGFTLINHTENTIVLKVINVKTQYLPSGLHGIPSAMVLKSLIKYRICINETKEGVRFQLIEPIQIPADQGVKFDVELYQKVFNDKTTYPDSRIILNFQFEFSGNLFLYVPTIYLNTMDENESSILEYIS